MLRTITTDSRTALHEENVLLVALGKHLVFHGRGDCASQLPCVSEDLEDLITLSYQIRVQQGGVEIL